MLEVLATSRRLIADTRKIMSEIEVGSMDTAQERADRLLDRFTHLVEDEGLDGVELLLQHGVLLAKASGASLREWRAASQRYENDLPGGVVLQFNPRANPSVRIKDCGGFDPPGMPPMPVGPAAAAAS